MLDIHVVSHTHWDREWYLTYEQFRFRLVALVDRLLDLLDRDPAYMHFHLVGQPIALADYLAFRPAQQTQLRQAMPTRRHAAGLTYVVAACVTHQGPWEDRASGARTRDPDRSGA